MNMDENNPQTDEDSVKDITDSYDGDGGDDQEDGDDLLDTEYRYPSVEYLVNFSDSMDYYNQQTGSRDGLQKSSISREEQYAIAGLLATNFAALEQRVNDPGMIMSLYEGTIYDTMLTVRLWMDESTKQKALVRFFAIGCGVLMGMLAYVVINK